MSESTTPANQPKTPKAKKFRLHYNDRLTRLANSLRLEPENARDLFPRAFADTNPNETHFTDLLDLFTSPGACEHMGWEKRERRVYTWAFNAEDRKALVELAGKIKEEDMKERTRRTKVEQSKSTGEAAPVAKAAKKAKLKADKKAEKVEVSDAPAVPFQTFEEQLASLDA